MTWWRFTQQGGGKAWLDDSQGGEFEALDLKTYPVADIEAMGDEVRAALGIERCKEVGAPANPVLYRPTQDFDGLTVTHVADPLEEGTARTQVIQWASDTVHMLAGLNGEKTLPLLDALAIEGLAEADIADLARLVEG